MSASAFHSLRSRWGIVFPVLVAIGLGLLAGVSAWLSLRGQSKALRAGWELVPVVVAAEELPRGAVLGYQALAERRVPEQFVTSSVVRPEGLRHVLDQRLTSPLQKGDLLLWSQLETTPASDRLSNKILKKARAITIATGPSSSVGGWIRPNDHVDVIGTFRDPQGQDPVAVTLLENVMVLATGKVKSDVPARSEPARDYSHVSLLVMPEEVEILVLAAELGSLSLSLRNEADLDLLDERGRADVRTLLSGQRTKDLRERRMRTIQVIKGAAVSSPSGSDGSLR